MKQQILFIHGGNPYSNYEAFLHDLRTKQIWDLPGMEVGKKWTQTLAEDLGENFEVFFPTMPNKQNAKYQEWKIWFERYVPYVRDGVILMGYSLGGYFLAKYLVENQFPVKITALYLLAAPFENDTDTSKEDGGDFAFDTEALEALTQQVPKVVMMHSQDDFVVPYEHALLYKSKLPNAELVTFTDKNHFLLPDFAECIEHIQQVARNEGSIELPSE